MIIKDWEANYNKGKILSDESVEKLLSRLSNLSNRLGYYVYTDCIIQEIQRLAKAEKVAVADMHYLDNKETLAFVILKGRLYQPIIYCPRKYKLKKLKNRIDGKTLASV